MVASTYYQFINQIKGDLNFLVQKISNYEKIEMDKTEQIQMAKKKLLKTNSHHVAKNMRIRVQNLEREVTDIRRSKATILDEISDMQIVLEGYEQIAKKLSS